jgi:hypothetical protein
MNIEIQKTLNLPVAIGNPNPEGALIAGYNKTIEILKKHLFA